jgi:hypothetical protein
MESYERYKRRGDSYSAHRPKTYPIRVSAGQLERWHKASRLSGAPSLREWIETTLNREAKSVLIQFNMYDENE